MFPQDGMVVHHQSHITTNQWRARVTNAAAVSDHGCVAIFFCFFVFGSDNVEISTTFGRAGLFTWWCVVAYEWLVFMQQCIEACMGPQKTRK